MRYRGFIVLAAIAAVPLLGGLASAAPIVDFMSGAGGGTISYLGGGGCPANSLCGANIVIEQVGGIGTPQHAGTSLPVTQGVLSFTSGSLVSFSGGIYTFAAGGANSFTITGAVAGGSVPSGTLFSGQLSTVTVDTTSASGVYLTVVNGSGSLNLILASYYGLGSEFDLVQGSLHVQPTTNCKPSCSASTPFGGNAFSIFLPETTSAPTPVPEPGTLVLLGSGLVAFASSGRLIRRRGRSATRA